MSGWALGVIRRVASEAPEDVHEALNNLNRLAQEVQNHLAVDRAKIYLVRRSPAGPLIWRVNSGGPRQSKRVTYSATEGLADWVIRKNSLLLIPPPTEKRRAGTPLLFQGEDREGNAVEVVARPEKQMSGPVPNGVPNDNECTLLYVPVSTGDQVSAVIGVSRDWRSGKVSSESLIAKDARPLETIAPAVAIACQRFLHLEKASVHLAQMQLLTQELSNAKNLAAGYEAVARCVGTLADCAAAILLEFRSQELGGVLFETGFWSAEGTHLATQAPLSISCTNERQDWEEEIRAALERRQPSLRLRRLLVADAGGSKHRRVLAICDIELDLKEPSYFSDRLLERYTGIFFESAVGSLDGLITQLGNRLIEDLTCSPEDSSQPEEPRTSHPTTDLLTTAAKLLRRATGADSVLVYGGESQARVLATVPESDLESWPPIGARSRTAEALISGEGYWILDTKVEARMLDGKLLAALEKVLRWPEGIGPWQVVPVLDGERTVGLLKLLAEHGHPFLGGDHHELAKTVAQQAAREVRRELRRSALERLNAELSLIGAAEGSELGEKLVTALRHWARETLMRPRCEVLLFARSLRSGTLIEATTLECDLREIPRDHRLFHKETRWDRHQRQPIPVQKELSRAGASAPIKVSGDTRLQGFVAIADGREFDPSEAEVLAEAARFLAVFLQAERERNDVRLDMGLFRHQALGAIQGLTSNAKVLAELAVEAEGPTSEVQLYRKRVEYEATQLRLWRENQRFYLSGAQSELRRFRQPLAPILKRCFARYRSAAELRRVEYTLELPQMGNISAYIDTGALETAISNLLDNAVKYVFNKREIILGLRSSREEIQIWIEDVGHGIPAEFKERIFDRSARRAGPDPFRVIAGQGLGLHLVQRIIDQHDGWITVTSLQEDVGHQPGTTSHRVRFTIHLPF